MLPLALFLFLPHHQVFFYISGALFISTTEVNISFISAAPPRSSVRRSAALFIVCCEFNDHDELSPGPIDARCVFGAGYPSHRLRGCLESAQAGAYGRSL